MRQVKTKFSTLSIFLHNKRKLESVTVTNSAQVSPDEDLVINVLKPTGNKSQIILKQHS